MKRFNFLLEACGVSSAEFKDKFGKIAKEVGASTKYNDDP